MQLRDFHAPPGSQLLEKVLMMEVSIEVHAPFESGSESESQLCARRVERAIQTGWECSETSAAEM